MRKKNNSKIFFIITLFVAGALIYFWHGGKITETSKAQLYDYVSIDHDTTWTKDDTLKFDKDVVIENGATLTMEKGTLVEFVSENGAGILVDDGRILANGTEKEKVIITSSIPNSGSYIQFRSSSNVETSLLRYVEISNLGSFSEGGPVAMKNIFIPTASAWEFEGIPALYFFSGKLHIENSVFAENDYADIGVEFDLTNGENAGDFLEVVNSNFEDNENNIAVASKIYCGDFGECRDKVSLKNNWYGDENGPSGEVPNDITQGEIVKGDVFMDGWRDNDMIADPVIIIPGIMGSANVLGKLKLDPILHTYDDLVKSFQKNGYAKNKNIFEFPYNWHSSNEVTASELSDKIKKVISQTKISKVDVVAHSMGGLATRAYIEGDEYENNIDQFVTLGTPHKGSPEAYLKWEAGEGFFGFQEKFGRRHFENEAEHRGYEDVYSYIRSEIPSIRELLPDYDYLFDVSSGKMRNYAEGYPANSFLEKLNQGENLEKLNKVNFLNITGNVINEQATISKIRVVDSAKPDRWEHGMPENFYNKDKDINQGLEKGDGDGTVPKSSSQEISSNTLIEIDSSHGDLPTKAQCEVLRELANIEENACQYVDTWDIPNILLINVFSPVDIQVVAPDGKRVGKNFATGDIINEIEGAYYTGYDTDVEFVTIPNPADGEYKLMTQGTGEGNYRIEAVKISAKEDVSERAVEFIAVLEGTVKEGDFTEHAVITHGDEVIISDDKDTEKPQISIKNPEHEKEYLNNEIMEIKYMISDNVSLSDNIQTSVLLDGSITEKKELDFSFLRLGEHVLKITAIDEAGNEGGEEVVFKSIASFQSIKDNIFHYEELELIQGRDIKRKLARIIREVEIMLKALDRLKRKNNIPNKAKQRIIFILEQNINRKIDKLIREINKKDHEKKRHIDPLVKILLVESLDFVKF